MRVTKVELKLLTLVSKKASCELYNVAGDYEARAIQALERKGLIICSFPNRYDSLFEITELGKEALTNLSIPTAGGSYGEYA